MVYIKAYTRQHDEFVASATAAIQPIADAAIAAANTVAFSALKRAIYDGNFSGYCSITPAPAWNGVAGTGFTSTPVDPARTTAKPALRLLVPPKQAYTDYMVVGVAALANNKGSLANGGIKKVILHYEGGSVTIKRQTYHTFQDVNGKTVKYRGWWVALLDNGTKGDADFYAEAVPKDATMQSRVIGPYTFFPSAAVYDLELTVAPSLAVIAGSRYQSILAALDYCRTQAKVRPRITITEARNDYLLGAGSFNYTPAGYITIDASVPVTIIGTTTYADATPRMKVDGLHFKGANITLDYKTMHSIYHESIGNPHWLDGVTCLNSGGRAYIVPEILGPRTAGPIRGGGYYTECTFTTMPNTMGSAFLARGNTCTNGFADCVSEAQCVIGNIVSDYNAYADWAVYTPSFSVTYTGGGTTATLELSGGSNANSRTFTAKVDGATVGTQAVTQSTTVTTVADWINGLAGWAATIQSAALRANLTSLSNNAGAAFGPQNVKSVTLQLYSFYDVHGDFYQQNSPANITENVIVVDNVISTFKGQFWFIASSSVARDFMCINNSFSIEDVVGITLLSQWGRAGFKSHNVFAHNSSTQQLLLRTAVGAGTGGWDADAYCLISNNAIHSIAWDGTPDTDVKITNNHYYGANSPPSGDVGGTASGDVTSLWENAVGGDFSPKGALLTSLKSPITKHDYFGDFRGRSGPAGAVA